MPEPANPQPQPLNNHDFTALYRKHRGAIRQFIFLMVTDEDLAADLTQDTFVKVYHKLHKHDPAKGSVQSWIYRTAKNTAIDYFRKFGHRKTTPASELCSTDEQANRQVNALAHCFQPELLGEEVNLWALVAELKPIYRQPLELVYVGGLTQQEAAAELKWPMGTVQNRIYLARQQLRKKLLSKGLETTASYDLVRT